MLKLKKIYLDCEKDRSSSIFGGKKKRREASEEVRSNKQQDKDKKKQGANEFQVGKKKLKIRMTPLAKAKATQGMEIEKKEKILM